MNKQYSNYNTNSLDSKNNKINGHLIRKAEHLKWKCSAKNSGIKKNNKYKSMRQSSEKWRVILEF